MKRTLLFVLVLCASFLLTTCNKEEPTSPLADGKLMKNVDESYVLTAGNWSVKQTEAVEKAGGTLVFSHNQTGLGVVTSSNPNFLETILASKAFTGGEKDMMMEWQPKIDAVEFTDDAITETNESYWAYLWNMRAVNAPAAWAAGYSGMGVRVAVIDGGINSNHVEVNGNIDFAYSKSFVTGKNFNEDVGPFWHGTHVAGIIAAADNDRGVIGVAPEATIISVKALDNGSGSFGAIIAGILYASTPMDKGGAGADIINLSLGALFPRGGGNTGAGFLVAALNKAVNYAGSKTLVVTSAGNDAIDLDHSGSLIKVPAQSGSAIAVSATGPDGYFYTATDFTRFASYSNYGKSLVWVAAPGGDFDISAYYPYNMILSCSGNGYYFAAGTSMSAPMVSGIAALVKQKYPDISVGALKNIIANSAVDAGKPGADPYYGRGFVNAWNAVQ